MKKTFILFYFITCVLNAFTQNKLADSILNNLNKAETEKSRLELMGTILYELNDLNQQERIEYAKKILYLSRKQNDKILESVITAEMGYLLAINGNNLQGTELAYNALDMALSHKNKQALGIIYQDLAICFLKDTLKNKQYLLQALPNSEAVNDYGNLVPILLTLSNHYYTSQNKDSALYYAQRAYEICVTKNIANNLPMSLIQLANIHNKILNNKGIALEYLKKAMVTKFGIENSETYVRINLAFADLFISQFMPDSALYYNNLALSKMDKAPYRFMVQVYRNYKTIYTGKNSDSALKYYKLYELAKDSIDIMSNAQQQQLLAIKNDIGIEQIALQRKQNIQYALIALGIIVLLSLYLLLSRSFITNTKLIEFFGAIVLLLVFEFLNLLLHPFLERITHHSPLLMLLALVAIAALLVPLHHKVEKWATAKLVEKNKQIRLAAAKKTIEQLDKESNGTLH